MRRKSGKTMKNRQEEQGKGIERIRLNISRKTRKSFRGSVISMMKGKTMTMMDNMYITSLKAPDIKDAAAYCHKCHARRSSLPADAATLLIHAIQPSIFTFVTNMKESCLQALQ